MAIDGSGGFFFQPAAGNNVVFNESGVDSDFRVESDGNSNALLVDAALSRVGINQGSPSATLHISTADAEVLRINPNTSGYVSWYRGATWAGYIDAESGGDMTFANATSGGLKLRNSGGIRAYLGTTEAVFNDDSTDTDFRVESDGNANMLFVDASVNRVGIGTNAPDVEFHLNGQNLLIDNDNGTLFIGTGTISYGGCIGIGRAGEAGFHIGSSQVGDLCIGAEVNTNIRFGTNTSGALSTRMTIAPNGDVNVVGAFSKGSGSFRIDHPLPEKRDTHHLVHSFVEAPQADNIYRGKVELVGGTATVNIDTIAGMTEGTFVALNREIQCFTSNETGWTAVRGSVRGNTLTIEAQDNTCTDTISWLVIGERQDQHMYDTDWTDDNGKVIVEPLKPVEK